MIPGTVSKISEGLVVCADVIIAQNDLLLVRGQGTINTIRPGLGVAQGQMVMLLPLDGNIQLGISGNIMGVAPTGIVIGRNTIVHLYFVKLLGKWVVGNVAETGTVPLTYEQLNITAVGGTITVPSHGIHYFYVNRIGSQVLVSLLFGDAIITGNPTELRLHLPASVATDIVSNRTGVGVWHDQNLVFGVADIAWDQTYIRLQHPGSGYVWPSPLALLLQINYMVG